MNLEGRKCVVCSAYLFEDDDVVICPECGAPHHRECWSAVGECRLKVAHGTEAQYKYEPKVEDEPKPETQKSIELCRGCGKEIPKDARFCPYCNMPRTENAPFGMNINFQRVDPDEKIADDVTVGEAIKVITVNSHHYVPRFRSGKKLSWNWSAFIWPHGWYAFRKMYLISALLAAIIIAASICTIPMDLVLQNIVTEGMSSYDAAMARGEAIASAGILPIILYAVGGVVGIGVRIFAALFADNTYKKKVVEVAKEIRTADDKAIALEKKGGVNFIAFGIALVGEFMLLNVIAMFL